MSEGQHDVYRNMLLTLSQSIDNEDLHRMKFKCDSTLGKRHNEKIKDPLMLFTALEERGYLDPTNTTWLKELLKTCCAGKIDGLRILEQYERGGAPVPTINHQPPAFPEIPAPVPGNQPQIIYVVNNTGGNVPNGIPGHQPGVPGQTGQQYDGPDLSQEISFLCRSLGRDWKFFMRALGIVDDDIENISADYRTIRERIHQCLLLWQQEHQQSANKLKLITACRHSSVQREDLAAKLEESNYR